VRLERAVEVFPRFAGAAVGSPSPLRPLWRRRGGGTPDLCVRCVNRVWKCVAGVVACEGAAAMLPAFWSSQVRLPLASALGSGDGPVGVPLCACHGGDGVRVFWGSPPWARLSTHRRLLLRRCGAAEVWRLWSGAGGAASEGELRLAVEGSGPSRPDQERSKIGACRRPTIVCVPDPVLRGWWLLRSIVALWLGVLPAPGAAAEAGGVHFRWRREDDGCLRVVFLVFLSVNVSLLLYEYKFLPFKKSGLLSVYTRKQNLHEYRKSNYFLNEQGAQEIKL
jgi:hypothetical protein